MISEVVETLRDAPANCVLTWLSAAAVASRTRASQQNMRTRSANALAEHSGGRCGDERRDASAREYASPTSEARPKSERRETMWANMRPPTRVAVVGGRPGRVAEAATARNSLMMLASGPFLDWMTSVSEHVMTARIRPGQDIPEADEAEHVCVLLSLHSKRYRLTVIMRCPLPCYGAHYREWTGVGGRGAPCEA